MTKDKADKIPNKEDLQALCEQLITCNHLNVKCYMQRDYFTVDDPRYYGYILEIRRESHSILKLFRWYTYEVKLRCVSITVSNPRKLFELAALRNCELEEKQRLDELQKAIKSALKHLKDEYRKEQK